MTILQIIILAIIQGLAELLPVSSSAHVILAQHFMGLDPSQPQMTFFLVMLHTGTMFAVLIYFWRRWLTRLKISQIQNRQASRDFVKALIIATIATGILGFGLKILIEKVILEHVLHYQKGEVERLFAVLPLIGAALVVSGLLIIYSGRRQRQATREVIHGRDAVTIGLIQGLCLPFRGLSRSGATISVGFLRGLSQAFSEEFSFALAVILTPPVIVLELRRLLKSDPDHLLHYSELLLPGLLGMVLSFFAGLVALRWLSSWLEKGRWQYFGYYCLALAVVVEIVAFTS
jgi:undecaprenyl-diphosphatase